MIAGAHEQQTQAASYKTRNWADYNAALKKRGSLTIWFDPDMVWTPPPSVRRGASKAGVMPPFKPA
ncbi:hypothetical protein SAMN04488567_0430 [Limimaricola pyoseonensis]|uniref:Transposase DDE domain-containing protein n=1 Tax=Limimaricola pyoseonensis TaxID=521013 RepID=A0A1G7LA93_9RHOB|nr:hypothetical protein SAMN04488567_0430 [Limimaricola pyoseonensis]